MQIGRGCNARADLLNQQWLIHIHVILMLHDPVNGLLQVVGASEMQRSGGPVHTSSFRGCAGK